MPRAHFTEMPERSIVAAEKNLAAFLKARAGDTTGSVEDVLSDQLRAPYRQIGWVYACVARIQQALRTAPLCFRRDMDPQSDKVEDSPITRLFRKPNPLMTGSQWIERVGVGLSLHGEVLNLLTRASGRAVLPVGADFDAPLPVPEQLWLLPGGPSLRLEYSKNDYPEKWVTRTRNGRKREIAYGASFLPAHYDPDRPNRGLGPMEPVLGTAASMFLGELLNRTQLQRGGEKSHGIIVEDRQDPDTFMRTVEQIRSEYDDAATSGRVRVFNGKVKPVALGGNARDMAYERLAQMSRKDVSAAFGVPDALLGAGTSNYATFQGEMRIFWETTIAALHGLICDAIAEQFLARVNPRDIGGPHYPYFDTSGVRALREDIGDQAAAAKSLMELGVPRDAALARVGLDRIEPSVGSDVPMMTGGWMTVEDVLAGKSGEQPPSAAPEPGAEPEAPESEPPAQAGGESDAAADPKQALNGAQIASLMAIIEAVITGGMEKTTAIELIVVSFPIDRARAEQLLADVEPDSAPAEPPADADEGEAPPEAALQRAGARLVSWGLASAWAVAGAVERRVGVVQREQDASDTAAEREAWYERQESRRESGDQRIARAVRAVWREIKVDQKRHLRAVADGDATIFGGLIYPADPAIDRLGRRALDGLARAWRADQQTTRELRAAAPDDPRLWEIVRACDGQELERHPAPVAERSREWFASQGALRDVPGGLRRLIDIALLRDMEGNLTEAEIDALVVAQEAKYADELAEKLAPLYQTIAAATAEHAAGEMGLPVLGATDPAALKVFSDTTLRLANDVNGTLAARVRSAIIRAMAEEGATVGTVRERVRTALGPLEATVDDQFLKANRRALTIARTETAFLDNGARYALHQEYLQAGMMQTHEWAAASRSSPPLGRTRPSHVAVDGTYVAIGQSWNVGNARLRHPADKQNGADYPEEIIHCRCALRGRRLQQDLDEGVIDQETFDRLTGEA